MTKPAYYWVLRGMRGSTARQNYLDYLDSLGTVGQPDGTVSTPRPPSETLYLTPFAFPLATNTLIRESAISTSWDTVKTVSAINTRTEDALPDGKTPIDIHSYHAPRVVRIVVDASGSTATSKRTGLKYVKYDNQSSSVPFGKKTGDTSVAAAYGDIEAAISNGTTIKTRLIAERS